MESYPLSYMAGTIDWDGRTINKINAGAINRRLDLLLGLGIREVMLSGYHLEEPASFDMAAEAKRVGGELAARGMRAAQHHGLAATFAPLDQTQTGVIDKIRTVIDWTADLNADVLVLHTGRRDGHYASVDEELRAFNGEVGRHGLDAVRDVCAANLRAAGRHAGERGVLIALENLDRFHPFGALHDLPELLARIDSPAVGFCLDTGHAWCAGVDPVAWIERLAGKLFSTHVHDNHGADERVCSTTGYIEAKGVDEHLPPGFGTIDWFAVIRALRRAGYARTLNFESGGWPGVPEKDGLRHAIEFWRACERQCRKPDAEG